MSREERALRELERASRRILGLWQTLLRLDDWDIELSVVKGYEGPGSYAFIRHEERSKVAALFLVDLRDWQPGTVSVDGLEDTIIHELLHLRVRESGYDYDEEKEEKLVHQLARSFLAISKARRSK